MKSLYTRVLLSLICVITGVTLQTVQGDDWPMYRNDPGRRGATTETLASNLGLSWSRTLPPLTPAFKDKRLQFDAGYEPVVAQGLLLLASSLTDSVKAYDTKTGQLKWSFYTNGPVRFAPAIAGKRVCFGSDDGYLYCVSLSTGELIWKYQAVPNQRRLLGNRRLISVWPVRGGPVIADDFVYFAAGVWPFEGVFVYALDIETGEQVWRNDRLAYMWGDQPHNTKSIGGLAPQGYLLVNKDELVVPCSNAYPARLNRHTGALIEFNLPTLGHYPGGWFAAIDPDQARAIRRGKLTFDEVINQHPHEGGMENSRGGVKGLSRKIQTANQTIRFDDAIEGVQGTIHSMIVADDALFVSTREGQLLCFREQDPNRTIAPTVWETPTQWPSIPEETQALAQSILEQASSQHGIAMVIGLKDGALTKALIQSSDYHVIVFDDKTDRVQKLRLELEAAGWLGKRASVIQTSLHDLNIPPYITTVLTTERAGISLKPLLQTLRPYGGLAVGSQIKEADLKTIEPGTFVLDHTNLNGLPSIRRQGPLPGSSHYNGDFSKSTDDLVKFPLGVLWFDDTLAHFKRSPQPVFDQNTMVSRPKNWDVPRHTENYKIDYPLLPPVLSDIYTGRILDPSERPDLRKRLQPSSPTALEPSQYRLPGQAFSTPPGPMLVGERINPLTGKSEPRTVPKTYGCDGGVDYGSMFTLRSGTAAFYDKQIESGTVFLSGPRSGCTNSLIPSGGVLNVPYYYDGCTCSYPLPVAMSLVAMPDHHEQWSSWGDSDVEPGTLQRLGLNFGAPGDRMTHAGTLWLDTPSVGGPSPKVEIEITPDTRFHYQHSMWMRDTPSHPWVHASMAEGLERCVIRGLKPGLYTVRLYFTELDEKRQQERTQNIRLQGTPVVEDFNIFQEAGAMMKGVTKEFKDIKIEDTLTLELFAPNHSTLISGMELWHQ